MRKIRTLFLAAVLATLGACDGSISMIGGDVTLAIAVDSASADTDVKVRLINLSGEAIGVGTLPCHAGWERREGEVWVEIIEARTCILPLLILPHGRSSEFVATTLEAGTYRLRTGGTWVDRRGDVDEHFTVWSNTIAVR
ncbi:MAG: hypothetical protein ABIR59_06090 [Gemmatimonadales bacterium]